MKYKKGDKVKIRSRQWYYENTNGCGNIVMKPQTFVKEMATLCGQTATITCVKERCYHIDIDAGCWSWTDDMFEDNNIMEKTLNITIPEWKKPKMTENENGWVIEWIKEEKSFDDYVESYRSFIHSEFGVELYSRTADNWPKEFKYGLLRFITDDMHKKALDWENEDQLQYELVNNNRACWVERDDRWTTKRVGAILLLDSIRKASKIIPAEFLKTF